MRKASATARPSVSFGRPPYSATPSRQGPAPSVYHFATAIRSYPFHFRTHHSRRLGRFGCRRLLGRNKVTPDHHKNGGDKEQGAYGCEYQSSDDRSTKWGILLATLS